MNMVEMLAMDAAHIAYEVKEAAASVFCVLEERVEYHERNARLIQAACKPLRDDHRVRIDRHHVYAEAYRAAIALLQRSSR
jgi:hypothetical protein